MIGRFAVEVVSSIDAIPAIAYDALAARCAAPAYYDRRFLRAAEGSPLLPCANTRYIVARDGDDLLGFLPVYQQAIGVADPFGLLAGTTSRASLPPRGAVQPCDALLRTRILATRLRSPFTGLFERLRASPGTMASRISRFQFADPFDAAAREIGLRPMPWLTATGRPVADPDFEISCAEHAERRVYEMRRQRRKFEASIAGSLSRSRPSDLETGPALPRNTARRGTPAYLPAADLALFIATCGDLVRLISIYSASGSASAFSR